jgi:hypothetical protein
MAVNDQLPGNSRGCSRFLRFIQIVGLLLLLVAAFRLSSLAGYLYDGLRMRHWEQVPATVLEADFNSLVPDRAPHVLARYRYRYDGQNYEGTRVEIAEGPQVITAFHKQLASGLKARAAEGTPATAFVNPADPSESVLDRQLRFSYLAFWLALILLLTLAGTTLVVAISRYFRRAHDRMLRKQAHPDQPWMWRADWAEKFAATRSYKYNRWVVAFVASYFLVGLPIAFLVLHEWGRDIFSWPGIVLIILGWGLFNAARLQIKHGRLFKGAQFQMSALPGLVGGPLAGAVILPTKAADDTKFRVVLECSEWQTHSDEDGTSSNRHVEWRDMVTVEKTISTLDATAIPVYFVIPFNCKPTSADDDSRIRWLLKAGIEESNFHRYATFEVPVFKTAESSRRFKPDPAVMQPFETPVNTQQVLGRLCRIESTIDGRERIRFTYLDSGVVAIAFVAIALCTAALAAIFAFDWHPAWAILPGGLGFMLLGGITLMFLWGSSLEVDRGRVKLSSGYFPFRRRYEVPCDAVLTIDVEKENASTEQDQFCIQIEIRLPDTNGPGSQSDPDHDVDVPDDEHRTTRLILVKRLDRRKDAEAVALWLSEKLVR